MNNGDREILRLLASQWMEIANQPVMAERKRQRMAEFLPSWARASGG